MKKSDMRSLQSMGQARAETMAAGTCVIRLLMKSLGIQELVTSPTVCAKVPSPSSFTTTAGSREDLRAGDDRPAARLGGEGLEDELGAPPQRALHRRDNHRARVLPPARVLRDNEERPPGRRPRARFHELMGVDSALSHVDQLRVAIAIIVSASASYASVLVDEFSPPLRKEGHQDGDEAVGGLSPPRAAREDEGSPIDQRLGQFFDDALRMEMTIPGVYAEELLARAMTTLRDEFKIDIDYAVIRENKLVPLEVQR